jgi:ATP-dependent Lon protease
MNPDLRLYSAYGCKQQIEQDLTPDQIEGVTIHYANRVEEVLAVELPKTAVEAIRDEVVLEEVLLAAV